MSAKSALHTAILAFCLVSAFPAESFSQGKINQVVLASVIGDVTVTDPNGNPAAAANGTVIGEGHRVVTGPGASLILLFSNGSTVTVRENSNLEISEFSQDPLVDTGDLNTMVKEPSRSTTRLKLDYGDIVGSTKKRRSGSTFHIETPVGIAGIRGTDWFVQVVRIIGGALNELRVTVGATKGTVEFTPTGATIPVAISGAAAAGEEEGGEGEGGGEGGGGEAGGEQLVINLVADPDTGELELQVSTPENMSPEQAAAVQQIVIEANTALEEVFVEAQAAAETGGEGEQLVEEKEKPEEKTPEKTSVEDVIQAVEETQVNPTPILGEPAN